VAGRVISLHSPRSFQQAEILLPRCRLSSVSHGSRASELADEVAAATTASLAKALPNARVQTFTGGGCSMIDDWEYFLESVDEFMLGVEQTPSA